MRTTRCRRRNFYAHDTQYDSRIRQPALGQVKSHATAREQRPRFNVNLFEFFGSASHSVNDGAPERLAVEADAGFVATLAIFRGRQNVADPLVGEPADGYASRAGA